MKPAFSHLRSTTLSVGTWRSIHSWRCCQNIPECRLPAPTRPGCRPQRQEALPDGVRRASARSKAIGVFVRGGFRDGHQRQQMQCLHGAVCHRRNAQRSQLAVGFRDMDSPQWLRLITAPPQRAHCFVLGRRGAPDFPVHARRSFALIVRHPFHGQGFAGKRAGQQPLQGFHLAPTLFLCCLDDTRLQPADLSFTLRPVNLLPCGRLAGGCTRRCSMFICHFLLRRFCEFSRHERPIGSLPVCTAGRCCSPYPPHYRAAFAFSSFLCLPPRQRSLRTRLPHPKAGCRVCHVDCNDTNELTPASHTGSHVCPCAPCVRWSNPLRAFWPEPVSIFGSLSMTMPEAVHLCWVFHSACPSDRIDARSRGNHLAAISSPRRWRDVVTAASDPTVASRASADRLLRTESQVRLTLFMSYRTIIVTTSFHTDTIP